jgi:hypothetical protein
MTGKTRVLCCSGHWECHLAHIFAALCSLRLSSLFLYSGNIQFRALVRNNKQRYLDQNDKNDKVIVVREVIDMVVETGGRFLELAGTDVMTGPWKHAVFARVLDKTTQGLRDTRWNSSASTTPSPRPERLVPLEHPESVAASNSPQKLYSSSRSPATNTKVGSDDSPMDSSPSESVSEHLKKDASPSSSTQKHMVSQVVAQDEVLYGGSKTAEERMSLLGDGSLVAVYWRKFYFFCFGSVCRCPSLFHPCSLLQFHVIRSLWFDVC